MLLTLCGCPVPLARSAMRSGLDSSLISETVRHTTKQTTFATRKGDASVHDVTGTWQVRGFKIGRTVSDCFRFGEAEEQVLVARGGKDPRDTASLADQVAGHHGAG